MSQGVRRLHFYGFPVNILINICLNGKHQQRIISMCVPVEQLTFNQSQKLIFTNVFKQHTRRALVVKSVGHNRIVLTLCCQRAVSVSVVLMLISLIIYTSCLSVYHVSIILLQLISAIINKKYLSQSCAFVGVHWRRIMKRDRKGQTMKKRINFIYFMWT